MPLQPSAHDIALYREEAEDGAILLIPNVRLIPVYQLERLLPILQRNRGVLQSLELHILVRTPQVVLAGATGAVLSYLSGLPTVSPVSSRDWKIVLCETGEAASQVVKDVCRYSTPSRFIKPTYFVSLRGLTVRLEAPAAYDTPKSFLFLEKHPPVLTWELLRELNRNRISGIVSRTVQPCGTV